MFDTQFNKKNTPHAVFVTTLNKQAAINFSEIL